MYILWGESGHQWGLASFMANIQPSQLDLITHEIKDASGRGNAEVRLQSLARLDLFPRKRSRFFWCFVLDKVGLCTLGWLVGAGSSWGKRWTDRLPWNRTPSRAGSLAAKGSDDEYVVKTTSADHSDGWM